MLLIPYLLKQHISQINQLRQYTNVLMRQYTSVFNSFVKIAEQHEEFFHDNLRLAGIITELTPYLTERGWYLAGQLPARTYVALEKGVGENRHDEIEAFMQEFARTRFDAVLEQIENVWPNRLPMVRDAIEAHKQGKFTLSIPVFLAQADGICNEIFQSFLFTKRYGNLAEKLKKLSPDQHNKTFLGNELLLRPLADAMIDALRTKSSLQVDTSNRDKNRKINSNYGPLNRHGVLHGIDLNYNTEPNSLRALLLIDYLIQIREIFDRYSKT